MGAMLDFDYQEDVGNGDFVVALESEIESIKCEGQLVKLLRDYCCMVVQSFPSPLL